MGILDAILVFSKGREATCPQGFSPGWKEGSARWMLKTLLAETQRGAL